MGANYALMWSGGKDSALALQRATAAGIHIARLVNFYDSTTRRVRFHATRTEMIQAQAHAAGIELDAISTTWSEMESRLGAELAALRAEGFDGVVFGDIHLADVREWYESRVRAAGLEHIEPIWGEDPAGLVGEFVESGGRAVITCVDLSRLEPSWLGRIIDQRFLEEIGATGIDPCGENGEFHSFAYQGPGFTNPVAWRPDEMRWESGFAQLDVVPG
ncbi:MAG: diphthine--ammonia ligase [Chloroflexi bacterium]|nr:MAG: diphthine--ammonia ligase [Chloroflexota bacterium]